MTRGTIINNTTGKTLEGDLSVLSDPAYNFDFRIDGTSNYNYFAASEWTFEEEARALTPIETFKAMEVGQSFQFVGTDEDSPRYYRMKVSDTHYVMVHRGNAFAPRLYEAQAFLTGRNHIEVV